MVPNINLLPNLENKKETPVIFYALLILMAAIVAAYMIILYFNAKSEMTSLSKQEEVITTQYQTIQQELETKTNENIGSLAQSVQFVEDVSYPVTPLINETMMYLPNPTYLRGYTFGEQTVTVTIDFETMTDISNYVEKLGSSNYFRDIQVDTIDHFDVALGEQSNDKPLKEQLKEIPRYSVSIRLLIDYANIVRGGEG